MSKWAMKRAFLALGICRPPDELLGDGDDIGSASVTEIAEAIDAARADERERCAKELDADAAKHRELYVADGRSAWSWLQNYAEGSERAARLLRRGQSAPPTPPAQDLGTASPRASVEAPRRSSRA